METGPRAVARDDVLFHAWRAAFDPGMRYLIAHKPFWHDYGASLTDYHMENWSDGDNFLVNDIGHPLEGDRTDAYSWRTIRRVLSSSG